MTNPLDVLWSNPNNPFLERGLKFFFPDIAAEIDWSKGYTCLDAELPKIMEISAVRPTIADKLFQVTSLTGRTEYIYIRVQTERDSNFEKRMSLFYCGILIRYGQAPRGLAILADDDPNWRSDVYSSGTGFTYQFQIAKILDFQDRLGEL